MTCFIQTQQFQSLSIYCLLTPLLGPKDTKCNVYVCIALGFGAIDGEVSGKIARACAGLTPQTSRQPNESVHTRIGVSVKYKEV